MPYAMVNGEVQLVEQGGSIPNMQPYWDAMNSEQQDHCRRYLESGEESRFIDHFRHYTGQSSQVGRHLYAYMRLTYFRLPRPVTLCGFTRFARRLLAAIRWAPPKKVSTMELFKKEMKELRKKRR